MSLLFRIYRGRKVSSYFAPSLTLRDRRTLCEGQFYYISRDNEDPDLGFVVTSRRTIHARMETAA